MVSFIMETLFTFFFFVFFFFFRAEELETALMEMVKQDNRRQLSAKVYRSFFLDTFPLLYLYIIEIMGIASDSLCACYSRHWLKSFKFGQSV